MENCGQYVPLDPNDPGVEAMPGGPIYVNQHVEYEDMVIYRGVNVVEVSRDMLSADYEGEPVFMLVLRDAEGLQTAGFLPATLLGVMLGTARFAAKASGSEVFINHVATKIEASSAAVNGNRIVDIHEAGACNDNAQQ